MSTIQGPVLAWHFTTRPGVLSDGTPFGLGQLLRVEGEIIPCKHGLHGSRSLLDAIKYAPGVHLYRVQHDGIIVPHGNPEDKIASSERTALQYRDATPLLQVQARACALDVIHLWDAPAEVMQFLRTGDPLLAAKAVDAAVYADAAHVATRARQAERLEAWALAFMEDGSLPDLSAL